MLPAQPRPTEEYRIHDVLVVPLARFGSPTDMSDGDILIRISLFLAQKAALEKTLIERGAIANNAARSMFTDANADSFEEELGLIEDALLATEADIARLRAVRAARRAAARSPIND